MSRTVQTLLLLQYRKIKDNFTFKLLVLKAEAGSLCMMSLNKIYNDLSAFCNSGGLRKHLSCALYSGFRKRSRWWIFFGQSQVISESLCSYWLICKGWCTFTPTQLVWIVRYNGEQVKKKSCSFNFRNNCKHGKATQNRKTNKERATTNEIKGQPGEGRSYGAKTEGGGGSGVASLGFSCYS